MLNLHRFYQYPNTTNPTYSRKGQLFFTRGQMAYALSGWPELGSFEKYGNGPWRPSIQAANRIYEAYSVPRLRLRAEDSLLLEARTHQVVMPEIVATGTCDHDGMAAKEIALCRIDQQWHRDFEATVPPDFVAIAERFRRNPIAILRLLTVCPETAILASSNAALFFVIACHFDQPQTNPALRPNILSLIRRPQNEEPAFLGFASSNSARRFFAKIPPADVCTRRIQIFSHALGDPSIARWLIHLPGTRHIAKLLSDARVWPYISPQLVVDICRVPKVERDISNEPGFLAFMRNWRANDSLKRLQWFHRQVLKGEAPRRFLSDSELQKLKYPPLGCRPASSVIPKGFPPPPIPGTPELIPLTKPEELVDEGISMKNCTGTLCHLQGCAEGGMYFYQLLSPERCTVMIEKLCDRDSWRITELRAHANRIPGFGTLQKVCDVLGIAAQPVWLREKSWWSDEQDCVCSPRKDSGGHDTGRTHSIDPDVDQMIADWTEFDKWPQQKFDFALSEALKALVIEHP